MCGSSSWRSIFITLLSAALNGTTATPSAPPFSNPSRVTRSRSPFVFSPPWHFTQCSFMSGAISVWKIASPFVIRST